MQIRNFREINTRGFTEGSIPGEDSKDLKRQSFAGMPGPGVNGCYGA